MTSGLSAQDLALLTERGIASSEAERQLALLREPPPPPRVVRPATLGDGIRTLPEADHDRLRDLARTAATEGRVSKFVPASGAATRMFKAPLSLLAEHSAETLDLKQLESSAASGSHEAEETLSLIDGLDRLPFIAALRQALQASDLDLDVLLQQGLCGPILQHLVAEPGLGLAGLPKGLVPFHSYPDGPRTAFMEHVAEAALYIADAEGSCRLHFTVPKGWRRAFGAELGQSGKELADRLGIGFQVAFSRQSEATDTLALNETGEPFRTEDGQLLLRPGGHGALLGNLAFSRGDLLVVKTVDNLVPERRHGEIADWKQLLLGYLIEIQGQIAHHLAALDAGETGAALGAQEFAAEQFGATPPESLSGEKLEAWLHRRLDRPVRVCGMVVNEGEPGGGPFWVRDAEGGESLQIVEGAEIGAGDRHLLADASHFNPVDLVCGVRDRFGGAYDLARYADPDAVFVTDKSVGGKRLTALERPGLWNGSMARWNTLFVEVPASTFAPVKTVADLLRPEHQPAI